MMRDYYAEQGIKAWIDDVPFYITSNPYIANTYANIVVSFIFSWIQKHPEAKKSPFYLVELGTGTGQFSFYLLRIILSLLSQMGADDIQIKYVMTDFAQETIDFWLEHDAFKPFVEKGVLDFAKFDLATEALPTLHMANETLDASVVKNPLVVLANYIFDTLPCDIVEVSHGQLRESLISVSTPANNIKDGKPISLDKLTLDHRVQDITPDYFEDEKMNTILREYATLLEDTFIEFPTETLSLLSRMQQINENMLVITSDKSYLSLDELENLAHPEMAFHGSFSAMVNLDAISRYVKQLNGDAILQTPREGLSSAVFSVGFDMHSFLEFKLTVNRYLEEFSPSDYFILYEHIEKLAEQVDLDTLVSFLALSRWDPYILEILSDRLDELLETEESISVDYLAANIHQIADNFYYLPQAFDVYFEVGKFFHDLEIYDKAYHYFQLSRRYFGEQFALVYNEGICEYHLEDYKKAQASFELSVKLDPKSKDAKAWLKRVAEQV